MPPPDRPADNVQGRTASPASHQTDDGERSVSASEPRVRVAVVDSGIHPGHPHVAGIKGGISFISPDGPDNDYIDRLGHGTAVAAAIREKAPDADLYAVKIFDRTLGTSMPRLVAAVDWAIDAGMQIINLSLGTSRYEHRTVLSDLVARAGRRGALIVAAAEDDGVQWLPGSLPGVVPVMLDWDCPRDNYRTEERDGGTVFVASGFPRSIPGVPPTRNLNGISFAVANVSGFLAQRVPPGVSWTVEQAIMALASPTRL